MLNRKLQAKEMPVKIAPDGLGFRLLLSYGACPSGSRLFCRFPGRPVSYGEILLSHLSGPGQQPGGIRMPTW